MGLLVISTDVEVPVSKVERRHLENLTSPTTTFEAMHFKNEYVMTLFKRPKLVLNSDISH